MERPCVLKSDGPTLNHLQRHPSISRVDDGQLFSCLAHTLATTSMEETVVLVVGGWSPGPLCYLQSVMTTRSCIVVQPRTLPMPPFPSGSWCCHPRVLLSMALCGVFMWLAMRQHQSILWNVLAILATLVSLRILAAVAVRTSIQVGARSCLETIQHLHHDNKLVLVGFSWGGAVSFFVFCW